MNEQQEKRARSLNKRGKKFLKNNELEKALDAFQKVRGLNPNNYFIHVMLGYMLWRMKRLKEAIASLRHAQELYELKMAGDDDDTADDADTQIQPDPQINYYLARCWKDSGEPQKGALLLKKTAEVLFGDAVYGSQELEEEPSKSYGLAESFSGAAMFDEAYDQLEPLVREKIRLSVRGKSRVASR
jgi:tetratricopeptide (TPR) repeat protein